MVLRTFRLASKPAGHAAALAGVALLMGFSAAGADAQPAQASANGSWSQPAGDFANTRFSPLDQINAGNVARLAVAWSFANGTLAGQEAAPLVVEGTMYLVAPFPDRAFALDLTKPGAPIKWSFTPTPTPVAIGKACCDTVNRGPALADGKLVYNLLDDHVVALDAKTGHLLWRTKMGDVTRGETLTMAPLIAGKKVLVGNSGDRFGVRGWIAALDLESGHELWRAFSTGKDEEVRIGADFKPFYPRFRAKDMGETTWPQGMAATGGGAVSGWISYDPKRKLIFSGTGSPAPRVPEQRPGANLWTSAMFARDLDTGMARWAYQFTPHDRFGWGGDNENLLLDLDIAGKRREALVQLNQNGFAYVLDRTSGELLSARPFAEQNWASGIDVKSGEPHWVESREARAGVRINNVCPSDLGAKGIQGSAFSPRTGLIYAGVFNFCMDLTQHRQAYIAGTPFDGTEATYHPADKDGGWGRFIAWDPVAGAQRWSINEKFMTASGALATAGDLVFYGTADGWFRAVDAKDGKVLWSHKLGSGIVGQPISYLGPDKRQYVAVMSGVGGAAMASASIPGFPARGGALYVFSLGGAGPGSPDAAGSGGGASSTGGAPAGSKANR